MKQLGRPACFGLVGNNNFVQQATRRRVRQRSTTSSAVGLAPVSVIFESNHLLVVNKPPGWHSVPNLDTSVINKCLLSELRAKQLGGGSDRRFLLPLHRLDQPCSGVLMLGKTKRIASRIQSNWNMVNKNYICVVQDAANLSTLKARSDANADGWWILSGYLSTGKSKLTPHSQRQGGWSVEATTVAARGPLEDRRLCSIQWRVLVQDRILLIQTNQGARHMIRALLSMAQCSIAGDLRYGAGRPLPDRSVALHAWRVTIDGRIPLGQQAEREFTASIPSSWEKYFSITKHEIETKASERWEGC